MSRPTQLIGFYGRGGSSSCLEKCHRFGGTSLRAVIVVPSRGLMDSLMLMGVNLGNCQSGCRCLRSPHAHGGEPGFDGLFNEVLC